MTSGGVRHKAPVQYARDLELFARFPRTAWELLRPNEPGFYIWTQLIPSALRKLPNPRIGGPALAHDCLGGSDRLSAVA
jgi:hypothetical protein